ncbi:hypothetical protein PV327_001331 [Microctonus hyperodae]|uniref:Uncharacterized protein n=1 Tax=Microctonus hyperodae TaxID=165561 RepID=A0AA39G9Z0_MICHY|nr:hypothetical protein PV327_001331 [Microctonus hyperodae]
MKSALDSPSETREESKNDDEMEIGIENQRYYENKNDNGDGEEFNNENMEDYDDILSELTKDEINIVNSLIDSTNTPSISKQSSQHIIQQNVDHAKASTSALEVPEIDPTYQHQSNKQNKITGSHQSKLKIFYPEILVFVDNNIIAKFITGNSLKNIRQLILYYIVYFNAIDMLFAKLATDTVVMHINIAGLVLESEPGTFPSGNSKSHQDFGNTPQQWHADKILFKYINYINTYKKSFPDDSFDFFFLSTNSGIRKSGKILSAHSRSSTNIYAQRRRNAIYTDLLGSVVHFRENYRGYIDATRAIAQILGIEYDPLSEESKINGEQCYSIMQKSQTDCQNCLKWSMRNQNEFNAYFRSNTNRCFLMNYPRSLRPFDQPAITVSSRAQCTCYGDGNFEVDRNGQEVDPFRRCHKKLICSAKRKKMSPLPLDGTPCDENKVCWGKKCVGVVTKMIPDRVPAPAIKRLLQIDPSRTDKIAKKSRLSRTASTIMGKN